MSRVLFIQIYGIQLHFNTHSCGWLEVLHIILAVLLIKTLQVSNKTEIAINWTVYLRMYNGKVSVR